MTARNDELWAVRRKWPDGPHYEVVTRVLGEDEYGVWLGAPLGTRVIRPDRSEGTGQFRVVTCVPANDWYLAHFWFDHPEVEMYVDICTPAQWTDEAMTVVDLDFDVIRWNDAKGGGVELVDEDEFEQHRVELDYPVEMQDNARRAATDVLARVQRGDAPFNVDCAAKWLGVLRQL